MSIGGVTPRSQTLPKATLPLSHALSPTVQKIMRLNPEVLLGNLNLLDYDEANQKLTLSPPFSNLLRRLVSLGELDPAALSVTTLPELNRVLQQPQDPTALAAAALSKLPPKGFLRPPGSERWHLSDNPTLQANRTDLEQLFVEMGFVPLKQLTEPMTVDHCIIFGARAERMEIRIRETVEYMKNTLTVSGHIFLSGSNRKVVDDEIVFLKGKVATLEGEEKTYWSEVLEDPAARTEANAFMLLWRATVPHETQKAFQDKLISINSTRIGPSYNEDEGHRPTTEVAIEDWMQYYDENKPQAIFALTQQPFVRLADQMRSTLVLNTTKGQRVDVEKVCQRIHSTTFHFANTQPEVSPLISIFLDETARSIYRMNEFLKMDGLA